MHTRPLALVLVALLPALVACPGALDNAAEFRTDATPDTTALDTVQADTGNDTDEPSCTPQTIVEDLFVPTCGNNVACHGDFGAGMLNLTQPDPAARVFGTTSTCNERPLAVAGDANASYFYEKLTSASPECGIQMPVGITLTDEQIQCVRDWIEGQP